MSIDKKKLIIDTAIKLFAEKGFGGTSIRDLAAEADVNVAMVNYYFGSKEKLFEAIIEHKAKYMKGLLDEIESNNQLSDFEKVEIIIEAYVQRILSNPGFHRILYQELMVTQRSGMHAAITNLFSANSKKIKQIIEKGIRNKSFKKVDVQLTVATMIGTINQLTLSKPMCNMLMDASNNFNPYTDKQFQKRITNHLKQLMRSHLLH